MPAFVDPPVVVRLRMRHRCLMCHKRCLIPCMFTASEFRQVVQDELDSFPPDDAEVADGSAPPT
jgi:hypothetical protein